MNIEEAIEILKDNIKSLEGHTSFRYTNYKKVQAIETLLTAYEKQQKEIEELNLENIELKQSKIVDKNSIPNQDNFYDCYNFIHKDKIKAKIEELEKLDFGTDLVSQFTANLTTITILQSLLEKE